MDLDAIFDQAHGNSAQSGAASGLDLDAIFDQAHGVGAPATISTPEPQKGFFSRASDWLFTRPDGTKIDPTSADYWLTRPSGERITPAQAVVGAPLTALNGLTFGLGDEIVAGGTAALDTAGDVLGGRGFNPGQNYDQRLNEVRGYSKNFAKASPIVSGALELTGGLKVPIGSWLKGEDSLVKGVSKLGAQGAAIGGAYGFGNAEGGFENRLSSAEDAAKTGAKASMLIGGPLLAAGKLVKALTPAVQDAAGGLERRSLQATKRDYNKTAKELGVWDITKDGEVETRTKEALDWFSQRAPETRDPSKLAAVALKESDDVSKQVGAVIKNAETAQTGPIDVPFERARQYLNEGRVPASKIDALTKQLDGEAAAIANRGKGKLGFIQQQKKAWGGKWVEGDDAMNGFNRAVYTDLQKTVEAHAPEVADLNATLSKYEILIPILKNATSGKDAESKILTLIQKMRTSGGVGGLMIPAAAAIAGGSAGGLPLAIGAGLLAGATTPTGQHKLAQALMQLPAQATKLTNKAGGVPRLAGILSGMQQGGDNQAPSQPQTAPQAPRPPVIEQRAPEPPVRAAGIDKVSLNSLIEQQPPLIRAMVWKESAGNPLAVSKAGARGLMQIMPEHYSRLGIANPLDPAESIRGGTQIIQEEMDRFGDIRLALAAYNAGAPMVQAAIKRAGSTDWAKVRQYLPQETRSYVEPILRKAGQYAGATATMGV